MAAPRALALTLSIGGFLDFQQGEWARAEVDLRRAIDLYRSIGSAVGEALAAQRLGALLTAQGRLDEAIEVLNHGVAMAERGALRSHSLARLFATIARNRLAAGDVEGAAHHLGVLQEIAATHGQCVTCNAVLLPEMIRIELALGRPAQAEAYVGKLEAAAERFASPAWMAMARQARGRYEAARGERERAAAAFHDAGARYETFGARYDAAVSKLLEAEVTSDRATVERLRGEAIAVLSAIGAPAVER